MSILIKTPFKPNKLETDPLVYGLRPEIIRACITELYNDKSILITGGRGIGKSSLCYQLQRILGGEKILLERCVMDINLDKCITVMFVCSPYDTLETIVDGIMAELEKKLVDVNKNFKLKEATAEFSFLGSLKVSAKVENAEKNTYMSLIDNFIDTMRRFGETYVNPHINIAIDELDLISEKENIAHFIKVVLEKMSSVEENFLSFILVGQELLFNRLYGQQPAFHRIVKHIKLYPLNIENAEYVFDACLNRADTKVLINNEAKKLLLDIAGGYPATIQLLGHEAFNCSLEKYDTIPEYINIDMTDMIEGIKNTLIAETMRFQTVLESLTGEEQACILTLADEAQTDVPFVYTIENLMGGVLGSDYEEKEKKSKPILDGLIDKQILYYIEDDLGVVNTQRKISFREELFRIYLNDKLNNSSRLDYI